MEEEKIRSLSLSLTGLFNAFGKGGESKTRQFDEYLDSLIEMKVEPWEMSKLKSMAKMRFGHQGPNGEPPQLPSIADLKGLLETLRESQPPKKLASPTCSFCGGTGFEQISVEGPVKGYPYTQARPCRCISARKVA
jgi:hypothetical protein